MKLLSKMSLPMKAQTTWQGLIENSLLATAATGLTYVAENASNANFGNYSPLVVGIASISLYCVKKILEIKNMTNPLENVTPVDPMPAPEPAPEPETPPTPEPVVVPEPVAPAPVVVPPTPVVRPQPIDPEEGSDFPLVV
jgi:outer membrane biosynthesis protein TonB